MEQKTKIRFTIILTIIELLLFFIFPEKREALLLIMEKSDWFKILETMVPIPLLVFINYYLLSSLLWSLKCFLQELFEFRFLLEKINQTINGSIQWFDSLLVKWAPYDTAQDFYKDHRIANMFEILLAFYFSNWHKKKPKLYERKLQFLEKSSSTLGWYSRTLGNAEGCETVMCTSLGLYTFALEKTIINNQKWQFKLKKIADHLWNCRQTEGWGIYVKKHEAGECRRGHTFWALRALALYLSDDQDFQNYVVSIFEKNIAGSFGYHSGDVKNVAITAMYLLLYYELPERMQTKINQVYNPNDAIRFIFREFCIKNVQFESEDVPGVPGLNAVPWQHMTFAYCIQALSLAHKYNAINTLQLQCLVMRIRLMIKKNVTWKDNNKCFFKPNRMHNHSAGIYTFPTAYLVISLTTFRKIVSQQNISIFNKLRKIMSRTASNK